jgi:LytS/YehU family sensor histidine kinase
VSDLLRATLERGDALESPLEAELQLLDLYVEVERARFGPRLSVAVDIPAGARTALVPTLVLQPLVENAVRHGVARVAGPAAIRLGAAVSDGRLEITVENTGAPDGAREGPDHGDGIGHANTRARLRELYGDAAGLTLQRHPDGGAVARLWVPHHTDSMRMIRGAG